MKKRTVKDFVALYAPEDEEKLVLIQDGVSADKTFLDTYWAAHTYALAMADVQTGQVISGRCYLSWPLTDKEWDAGDYSKRFAKGKVYRIMARRWKGDELDEPRWYVTQVLEEGIPCPALEELWAEYTKPVLLKDEVLGTLTLDREMSYFSGTCQWMGKEVQISLDVEIEKKASWTRVTNVMKKLLADQEVWDKSLRTMAAQKLTAQANEWLADNDQTDRDPEKDPITEDEFARRIRLTEFTGSPGGRFTAWFEDDDMFWGHVITVDGTLKKGAVDADIQGQLSRLQEASIMCEHCRNIQTWRKFDAPKNYLACIAYIQQLVTQGNFELMAEESTCPLEKVKAENGWADEIIVHMIRCKHCGQLFTCVVNTWRGSGHFKKGKS